MNAVIIYNHGRVSEEAAIMAIFMKKFPQISFIYVVDPKLLFRLYKKFKPVFVMFHWNSCPNPTRFVEDYYQKKIVHTPLLIPYQSFNPGHMTFLNEYGVKEYVCVNDPLNFHSYVEMFQLIANSIYGKNGKALFRRYEVLFFSLLHNAKIPQAIKVANVLFAKSMLMDRLFYQAMLAKYHGELTQAISLLTKALTNGSGVKHTHLLGNVCYHRGEWHNAMEHLGRANQQSPYNINRLVTLHECFQRLGKPTQAIQVLKNVKTLCPDYKRIDNKIVALIFVSARLPSDLDDAVEHLKFINSRDLIKLYKEASGSPVMIRRKFLDFIIREFSLRANHHIKEFDFGGALKWYRHIGKIIDPNDTDRYVNYLYCVSRAHFKLEHYADAKKSNDKGMQASAGCHDKTVKLGLLIDKVLKMKKRKRPANPDAGGKVGGLFGTKASRPPVKDPSAREANATAGKKMIIKPNIPTRNVS